MRRKFFVRLIKGAARVHQPSREHSCRIKFGTTNDVQGENESSISNQENVVKKLALALSTGLMVISLSAPAANAQTVRSEAAAHPRIVRAIENLEDAIGYLEAAPNNFGGHKAAAIQASRAAIAELRASLAFRAQQDRY